MAEHHIDIKLNGKSLFTTATPAPCPHCPPEPIARELAVKFNLSEYVTLHKGTHWRKHVEGGLIARELYVIDYWHAFIRAAHRERKLIESRY